MPTILVVDDSKVERHFMSSILRAEPRFRVRQANNGRDALKQMGSKRPDLIVTDLTMPEMDGLELVRAVRVRYSKIPVILVTAYGSEGIALEALEQGAADFVAKSELKQRLLETVTHVLKRSHIERGNQRLAECMADFRCVFLLDNDPMLLDPLVDYIQQVMEGMCFNDANGRTRTGVALKEAVLNALYHGNLEIPSEHLSQAGMRFPDAELRALTEERRLQAPYCDRRIRVSAHISSAGTHLVVRDDGPGFDQRVYMRPGLGDVLDLTSHRGIILMQALMDEVKFNDAGNEVTLVKLPDSVTDHIAQSISEHRQKEAFRDGDLFASLLRDFNAQHAPRP